MVRGHSACFAGLLAAATAIAACSGDDGRRRSGDDGEGGSAAAAAAGGQGGGGGGVSGGGGGGAGGGSSSGYDCAGRITAGTSLDDLEQAYDPAQWKQTALDVLARRYPDGAHIIEISKPGDMDFWVNGKTGTFDALLGALGVAVHETVHKVDTDIYFQNPSSYTWVIAADDHAVAPTVATFPRAEIKPYLPAELQGSLYASTYLDGASGGQDIESVLEEFNAYAITLYIEKALSDHIATGGSHRDGLLTFMLYTALYLEVAAQDHPADLAAIQGNAPLSAVIVRLWDRAVCLDELTLGDAKLGYQDDAIRPHVYAKERVAAIDALR